MAETEDVLWHKKCGHFNSKTLTFMKNNMVYDLSQITNQSLPCLSCALGKSHRKPFSKKCVKNSNNEFGAGPF